MDSRRWGVSVAVTLAVILVDVAMAAVQPSDCALLVPAPSDQPEQGSRCITFDDVNSAFHSARSRSGPRRPAVGLGADAAGEQYIGQLGTALEETTRLLAHRFCLSRSEVLVELGQVDTRLTDIAAFCPSIFSSERHCRPTRFRRHDGLCNNLERPGSGAALQAFRRLLPPDYADDAGSPRLSRDGRPLPSPRLVSAHMHRDASPADRRITFLFVTWGQLIDHDITLTAETKDPVTRADPVCCPGGPTQGLGDFYQQHAKRHPNCLPVDLPPGDPMGGPAGGCMELVRSLAGVRADCSLGPRAQINLVTSFIDAGVLYGSSFRATDALRLLRSGLLREDGGHLMPAKQSAPQDGCIQDPRQPEPCFLAGDNRANEQLGLAALHTVLLRQHNAIARGLAEVNPHWDDERLFQESRHILAAVLQHITYREFLPRLLGDKAVRQNGLGLLNKGYSSDYNASLDATAPEAFAVAAFRFGHSLLPGRVERWGRGGRGGSGGSGGSGGRGAEAEPRLLGAVRLADTLQRPFLLRHEGWVPELLLGMTRQAAAAMDAAVTAEVTQHLFQPPGRAFGRDLATMNLARAREHGLPGYNHFRALCGLPRARTWADMAAATDNHTAQRFAELFHHPDDVDLWSAGIAERRRPASPSASAYDGPVVGPTFQCIIARTFRNLKQGDRFWYELSGWPSSFSPAQLQQLRGFSLARLLCETAGLDTVQVRPMELPHAKRNPVVSCTDRRKLPRISLKPWQE